MSSGTGKAKSDNVVDADTFFRLSRFRHRSGVEYAVQLTEDERIYDAKQLEESVRRTESGVESEQAEKPGLGGVHGCFIGNGRSVVGQFLVLT